MEVELDIKMGWHTSKFKVVITYDTEFRVWEGKVYPPRDHWDSKADYGFSPNHLKEVYVAEGVFDLLFIILAALHEEI